MSDGDNNKEEKKKEQNNQQEKKGFPFSIKKDKESIKLKLKENIEELADKFSWKRFITRLITNKKFLVGLAVVVLAGIIYIPHLSDSTSQPNSSQDKAVTYEHIPAQEEKSEEENQQQLKESEKNQKSVSKENVSTDKQNDSPKRAKEENKSKSVVQQAKLQPKFTPPLKGAEMSRSYGWSKHPMLEDWRYHQGVDLQSAQGTPIRAAAGGKITKIKEDDYLGLVLIIEHSSGYQTIYGHAKEYDLKEGQQVKAGQTIGTVGTSGLVMQPTLHFAVLKDNEATNPTEYINL